MSWLVSSSLPLRINLIQLKTVGQVSVGLLFLMWRFIRRDKKFQYDSDRSSESLWEITSGPWFYRWSQGKRRPSLLRINSLSITFIPKAEMKEKGYGYLLDIDIGTTICYNKHSRASRWKTCNAIMIVEDEAYRRGLTVVDYEQFGMTVINQVKWREAPGEKFQAADLLIDINMPQMNGLDYYRQEQSPSCHIIFDRLWWL